MTAQNRRAHFHYLECRAVGAWPADPIVRRNARIIREYVDQLERRPMEQLAAKIGVKLDTR